MITPHNIRGVIFLPYNSLMWRHMANMVGTTFRHRGVKN